MPTIPVMKIWTPPTTKTATIRLAQPVTGMPHTSARAAIDAPAHGQESHGKAEVGRDLQRGLRVRKDGVGGETGELGKGVARPPLLAPMVRQLQRGDGKAHEAQARGEKPHLLTHLPEPLGDAVGEDAEVALAAVEVD